jgi:chromosome segregation ATPase
VSTLTGRIQIQGRFIKEWGDSEFGILLHMVNNVNDMKSNNPSTTTFLEAINKKLSGNLRASSSSEASTSREQTFSMIKTHLAALEADFVTYKEENNKTVQNLTEIIEMKDTEINALKEEIMLLKKNNDEKQQLISDLTVKQLEIEEKISSSTKEQKKQFERNTNMITSLMKKQDTKETPVTSSNNNEELPATSCNSPQTSYYPNF